MSSSLTLRVEKDRMIGTYLPRLCEALAIHKAPPQRTQMTITRRFIDALGVPRTDPFSVWITNWEEGADAEDIRKAEGNEAKPAETWR